MKEQKFRKLNVWIKAMDIIEWVYRLTKRFPEEERYGLSSQLRRAAVSIALNIAEGSGADTDLEFKRFLTLALRSSYELMAALEIANRLGYFSHSEKEQILSKLEEASAMLSGLKKKLKADS